MEKDKEKLLNHPIYKMMKGMARTMESLTPNPSPIGRGVDYRDKQLYTLKIPVYLCNYSPLPLERGKGEANNILRDTLIGMIPFFVGDVWDIFYRSYGKNLRLITGYINGDSKTVSEVHRMVVYSVIIMIVLLALIILMFKLVWMLGAWLFTSIGNLIG